LCVVVDYPNNKKNQKILQYLKNMCNFAVLKIKKKQVNKEK